MLEARAALASGALAAEALLAESLAAARRGAALNALAHLADADALAAALAAAPRGPLFGIPVTVKDLFAVDAMPLRAGTRATLPDVGAQGEAVSRLVRAGAIVLGKTNMHEIAAGVSGENPWTGDVCNPHDPARQAGGSSSGSAVAVATGVGLASLGSDTGGSIRIPAALCGVVGMKPSYGAVPLGGALPLSWSCDHAGPLARSVADAHCLLEVLADRAFPLRPPDACAPARLGVPRRYLDGWLGAPVERAFDGLLAWLARQGVALVDVDAPSLEHSLAVYGVVRGAESAWIHRAALARDPDRFSAPVRERLLAARATTAHEYFDAQQQQRRMREELAATLHGVDAWILPSAPLPAPLRGSEDVELPRGKTPHRVAFVRATLPFNLTGAPALSLPFAAHAGLPLGVQIAAAPGADARVLEIARWLETKVGAIATGEGR
ncbi:MAG: amidase [Proteobacteria bacterium]|nr:MAG: amidase [Pseudomonadota bacterium]